MIFDAKTKEAMTPGTNENKELDLQAGEFELSAKGSTGYRALVARAIYLSQDRTDIQPTTKELSR